MDLLGKGTNFRNTYAEFRPKQFRHTDTKCIEDKFITIISD